MILRRTTALAAAALLALTAAGCSNDSTATSSGTPAGPTGGSAATDPNAATPAAPSGSQCYDLDINDAWVRANETGKTMTGAFAAIKNTGKNKVTIVSGTSERAKSVELHQTSGGTMSAVDGGFTIEPGATLTLAPGKNHIMLMGLSGTLLAGETVPVVLKCTDGSTTPLQAEVRTYSGAQDTYHPATTASATTAPAGGTVAAPMQSPTA